MCTLRRRSVTLRRFQLGYAEYGIRYAEYVIKYVEYAIKYVKQYAEYAKTICKAICSMQNLNSDMFRFCIFCICMHSPLCGAGPNNLDRDIRLDLLGPAAFQVGSGPSWSNLKEPESDANRSGMERVDGGGYGESNRDGPGSTKIFRYASGKVALFMAMSHVTVGELHRFVTPHHSEKGGVV
jgi:hypothetical protein